MAEITEIDGAIEQVERLYKTLTGVEAPANATPYAAIPPEKNPHRHVEEQLDRLLGMLAGTTPMAWAGAAMPAWSPALSIWESPQEYVVCVDLPGVPREAIQVSVIQSLLCISGQRPLTRRTGPDDHRLRLAERQFGAFRRAVTLPPGAQADAASAQLRDGVLEIRLPRTDASSAATKAITIQ